jgi:beta-lactamase superfamily II metal-dependent hydrolase
LAKATRYFSFFPRDTRFWLTVVVPSAIRRTAEEPTGPTQARKTVATYLWSRGFQQIDVVELTHAQQDHIGGLTAISGI